MVRRLLLALVALAALAGALSFAPAGQAQEVAGSCTPAGASGGVFSVTYGAMPPTIPDNDAGGIELCMQVTSTQVIDALRVRVDIEHSWVGDLIVTLRHESTGTTVTLLDRPGVPANPSGCSGDDILAWFQDDAPSPAEDACAPSTPTLSGLFRPASPLAAFEGETMGGRWWLHVSDVAPADTGVVHEWGLLSPLWGDADCNGHVNAIDAALVLQFDAGLTGPPACPAYADFNLDLQINSIDAALILQYTAGLLGP